MSPTARRLVRIAAVLFGLLILLVLALPYIVSLDSMKARVVSVAESALHRKVEIGKMRLQILSGPGAAVEKFTVLNGQKWSTQTLVSADRVSVKVAFWPLLSRRVEVRKIVLDGATVAIERDQDGKLNIDDFLSAGQRESAPASRTAATVLLVSRIEIDHGRLLFVDRKVTRGEPVTLALEDLTGRITDIGPKTPARFDLAARFLADSGRNLSLKGALGPPLPERPIGEAPLQATFSGKILQLKRLAPYVAAFRENDPGTFSIEGKAEGKLLGALNLTGNLALDPAAPTSPIPATDGTFALNLDWTKGTLAIARSLFDVAGLSLAVEGRLEDLKKAPRVDIRISTPGDVPIDDVTGLPGLAGRLPEGVKLAGRLRLDAQIQGSSSDLETRGSVDAAPFAVSMNGQPFFTAPAVQATLGSRGKEPLAGRVSAPSGKLKNLPFEKLVADWTWDKGALTLAPSASVFGGTIGARVESNLAQPKSESRVSLEVKGVQAQPLVESLTTVRDVFAGTMNGTMALSTHGLAWDAISKTARGEGRLSVADADLRTVQLMPEVARSLTAVGKVAGFQVPASLESTKFSTMETSLKLADGRLATPDLSLSGRDVSATADGSIGLDKTLSYQGRVILGPSVVKSLGGAGRYIADSQGRLALPFKVSGLVTAPKVTIDESILLDLGRRVLARQAGEKLGGTAGKVLGDVLGSGDGKKTSPADLLQQFLRAPAPTPTPK
ncbi:MAG: AsmA family protein [Thermoanaerobaculia bacterium]